MNTESCDMIKQNDPDALFADAPIGSFCIVTHPNGQRVMWLKLPSGNGSVINLRPVIERDDFKEASASWEWDGNEDKPTLTPSVHSPGQWHGWIRNGRMESC